MKKAALLFIAVFIFVTGFAQNLSKITITGNGTIDAIGFALGENVIVNIGKDGNIGKWGYDRFQARGQENYQEILDTYVGRVEYYGQTADEAYRGKVKNIGSTSFTYYASYENDAFKGKLKTIGSNTIEYYQSYDNESYKGNIKSIGGTSVTWYSSYDNEALRGKLKSVGSTNLGYYGSFDDKAFKGKLKNIDSYTYTYYSSFEKYGGSMKSGASMQTVGSVRYYVRNY